MRVKGVLAYDGTDFHGWASQPGLRTVQGSIEDAIATVVGAPVRLTVAGRTDAGVHAWGQVISADLPGETDLNALKRSLNSMCGPEIALRSLVLAASDFSARSNARARVYVYRIRIGEALDPFSHGYEWTLRYDLDVDRMQVAAQTLMGLHDFAAFCKVGSAGGSVRRIESIELTATDDQIEIWTTASSFCHQMVRSISGLLVDIGRGARSSESAAEVLESRDPQASSNIAPPTGLTLWTVRF